MLYTIQGAMFESIGMLVNHDRPSLDIFWLRDESLEESDRFPDPDVLAQEIVDNFEAAFEQFRAIANALSGKQE